MPDIETIRLLLTMVLVPLAGWAYKQWRARDEAIEQRGAARAEAAAYKESATAAINQKNMELNEAQAENDELRSWILRLIDHELPRMQRLLDERSETVAILATSHKQLSDAYTVLAQREAVDS